MREDRPSRTAMGMAIHRAAHQKFDHPPVFEDPFAERILSQGMRAALEKRAHYRRRRLSPSIYVRSMLAARSRVAEEALALAVGRGVRQYVVLGAGLDTFALRNTTANLRVFEVDYPSTQAYKKKLLDDAGIAVPSTLRFVPVDFEKQKLRTELVRALLDPDRPTFFSWLGVIMYLRREDILATLRAAASLAGPSGGIAFDFIGRPPKWNLFLRAFIRYRSWSVARVGEPFKTFLSPDEARELLTEAGFKEILILGPKELNARYFTGRGDALRVTPVSHVAVATNGATPL